MDIAHKKSPDIEPGLFLCAHWSKFAYDRHSERSEESPHFAFAVILALSAFLYSN
jgi:hypothetical protein